MSHFSLKGIQPGSFNFERRKRIRNGLWFPHNPVTLRDLWKTPHFEVCAYLSILCVAFIPPRRDSKYSIYSCGSNPHAPWSWTKLSIFQRSLFSERRGSFVPRVREKISSRGYGIQTREQVIIVDKVPMTPFITLIEMWPHFRGLKRTKIWIRTVLEYVCFYLSFRKCEIDQKINLQKKNILTYAGYDVWFN